MKTEPDHPAVRVLDEALIRLKTFSDNTAAADAASAFAQKKGLSQVQTQMLVTAVYELGNNILTHANNGELCIQVVERYKYRGIRVIATDQGPGIADIRQAIVDGYTTQPRFRSLGLGLGGVSRLMDEMLIDSQLGKGTRITACKWR